MTKEEMKEKIDNNEVVKLLKEVIDFNCYLTGGAVIDIIEDRVPKDYDLISSMKSSIEDINFEFKYETKTSKTYMFKGHKVQLLKTKLSDFEFKISQSLYNIKNGKMFEVDMDSYRLKQLIPTSFDDSHKALNCLKRLPHWEKKGYKMHPYTYQSLLNAVAKSLEDALPS